MDDLRRLLRLVAADGESLSGRERALRGGTQQVGCCLRNWGEGAILRLPTIRALVCDV